MKRLIRAIIEGLEAKPEWQPLLQDLAPDTCRFYIRRGNHKNLVFLFTGTGTRPRLVIKQPRDAAAARRITREVSNIKQLAHIDFIPRPFALVDTPGGPVNVSPWINAVPLHIRLSHPLQCHIPRRWFALLDQAAARLLHLQTSPTPPPTSLGTLLADAVLFQSPHAALQDRLRSGAIPTVVQHGDYNPANLLVYGRDIRLIDWEWARIPGLPLVDLFNLALRSTMLRFQWGHHRGGLPGLEHARYTFEQDTREHRFLQSWVCSFAAALNLDDSAVDLLFRCFMDFTYADTQDEIRRHAGAVRFEVNNTCT